MVISGVISRVTITITHVRGLITLPLNPKNPIEPFKGTLKGTPITLLTSTHEPPSRAKPEPKLPPDCQVRGLVRTVGL